MPEPILPRPMNATRVMKALPGNAGGNIGRCHKRARERRKQYGRPACAPGAWRRSKSKRRPISGRGNQTAADFAFAKAFGVDVEEDRIVGERRQELVEAQARL